MSERLPEPHSLYSARELARAFDAVDLPDLAERLLIAEAMCDGSFLTGIEQALEHIRGVVNGGEGLSKLLSDRARQLETDIESEHTTDMNESYRLARSFVSGYPGVLLVSGLVAEEDDTESVRVVEDIVLQAGTRREASWPVVVVAGAVYAGPSLSVSCDVTKLPDDLRSLVEPNLLELNT